MKFWFRKVRGSQTKAAMMKPLSGRTIGKTAIT